MTVSAVGDVLQEIAGHDVAHAPAPVEERHWLKDTTASVYRSLVREYTRVEFDLRRAWLVRMERYIHLGERDQEVWRRLQHDLVEAQMVFLNAARRSLSRSQPPLTVRVGGPLISDGVEPST